jgi:hypothetical protein
MIFWERTSFRLVWISGRGVFPLDEPDRWEEESAITALCLSRAANVMVVDAVEHCLQCSWRTLWDTNVAAEMQCWCRKQIESYLPLAAANVVSDDLQRRIPSPENLQSQALQ